MNALPHPLSPAIVQAIVMLDNCAKQNRAQVNVVANPREDGINSFLFSVNIGRKFSMEILNEKGVELGGPENQTAGEDNSVLFFVDGREFTWRGWVEEIDLYFD